MFVRGQKSSRPLLSTGPVRQAYRRHGVAGCRASECCVHPRVPRIGSVSDESLERQATTMKLAQKIGGIVVALIVGGGCGISYRARSHLYRYAGATAAA